jgi:hypothetical protein
MGEQRSENESMCPCQHYTPPKGQCDSEKQHKWQVLFVTYLAGL